MVILSKSFPTQSFIPPPLNGRTHSILELIAHHVKHNPNYPVFQYADSNTSIHQLTWSHIASSSKSVAQFVENHCSAFSNTSDPYIIGIIANLDSITYFCLILGIQLAGCVPFPISPRNSAEGLAHLLFTTNCNFVLMSEDKRAQDLCDASLQLLGNKLPSYIIPALSSLIKPINDPVSLEVPHNTRRDGVCIIYHSSGSTGHPKAIYQSHEAILTWGIGFAYRDSGIDPTNEIVSIHGLPFYHSMVYCLMLSCMTAGTIASVFSPSHDTGIPTPESVLNSAVASHSNMMLTLPSFLEAWSKDPESLQILKGFTSIMYSGGSVLFDTGEKLFREGVALSPMYGSTETGSLTVFLRTDLQSVGWSWMKTRPGLDLAFIPTENGFYKLIIKENELRKLPYNNQTVDGIPAYDTKDIVERHSTDPTLWRVMSRQDTLIVHSSGEKTNPIPIEECLQKDRRIAAAIMFGREQLQAGVIILPAEGHFDTANLTDMREYRDQIWDTVLEANANAPAHSRIFKEMIIIANSNRPFEYTDKGFPKRHSILKEYHEDIQKIHSGTNEVDYDISIANGSDLDTVKDLVRSIVNLTLSQTIGDDENIFSYGADSLTAMSIRNSILRVFSRKLPSEPTGENKNMLLPTDFVFSQPTINAISSFISNLQMWPEVKELLVAEKNESKTDRESNVPIWNRFIDDVRSPSGMVKYKEGSGDIPLILLPDVGGSAGTFRACHGLYKGSVWSVDTTQVAPTAFATIHELAEFYFQQIKSERPIGPYRFASFSGSCVVLVCLVKLLEQAGDEVIQVSFLDHFPNYYFQGVSDPSTFNPNQSSTDLENYIQHDFNLIEKVVRAEVTTINPWFAESEDNNLSIHPLMEETSKKRIRNTISITIKLLFGDDFRVNGEWSRDLYDSWLKSMKVVPTVYLTTEGLASFCENPEKEFASGLGVKEAYPNARVVVCPGQHIDVLSSKVVIDDLEKGFL